jgi:nitroreductase
MQAGLRAWINLANGSTLAGLGVAALGGARVARSADRLFTGTGYRLPVPPAPAFCLGNVIVALDPASALFRHEARHATQYACCGGLVMVPLYLAAAAVSWLLTGETGCRNVFERRAGLTDGGYTDKALRPVLRRAGRSVAQAR